jgi:hypothetical protein
MVEATQQKGTNLQPMDDYCFDIMTQAEKKADF